MNKGDYQTGATETTRANDEKQSPKKKPLDIVI